MIFHLSKQISLYLKLLSLHLRFQDLELLMLSHYLLFCIIAKASHFHLNLFQAGVTSYYLGKRISNFPLNDKLIISDLMIASNHLLGPLDNLILKDIKPLLQLTDPIIYFTFLVSKLRILVELHLDLILNSLLHLTQITLCHI